MNPPLTSASTLSFAAEKNISTGAPCAICYCNAPEAPKLNLNFILE